MFRRLGMAGFGVISTGEFATVQVLTRSADVAQFAGPNAFIVFKTTGVVDGRSVEYSAGNTFVSYNWLSSGGTIANGNDNTLYDIRYVRTAGSNTSLDGGMSNNTWYNLNTDRTMYLLSQSDGVTYTLTATVAIKYNANSTIISSATCDWSSFNDIVTVVAL